MAVEPLNLRPYHRALVLWALHRADDYLSAAEIVEWAGAIALGQGKDTLLDFHGPRVGGLLKELKTAGKACDQYRHNPRSSRSEPTWKLVGPQDRDMPFPAPPSPAERGAAAAGTEQLVDAAEFEALAEAAVRAQASLEMVGAAFAAAQEQLSAVREGVSKALAKVRAGGAA